MSEPLAVKVCAVARRNGTIAGGSTKATLELIGVDRAGACRAAVCSRAQYP